MKEVYIVSTKRSPIGGFLGSLSSVSATKLGAHAIKNTYESIQMDPAWIDSVYMGNVLSADLGQSPARQAAIFAGIPVDKDASTINKVCASGMKATMLGAQQIQMGLEHIVVTGGMESMSNVPHYTHIRQAVKYGDVRMIDGVTKDGLWDVYNGFHMGSAAELAVNRYGLSRQMQDEFAIMSYERAQTATKDNKFRNEVALVSIPSKQGVIEVEADEDIYKIIPDKVSKLKPAFEKDGTITAANASNLNDGAAACILASKEAVDRYGLKPLAKIIGYADAAQAPEWFTTSPSLAIPKALHGAGLTVNDIDYFEINEAYAAVVLANQQILGYQLDRVNVYGGAVAMGHPIGASGARILTTLVSVLKQEGGNYGVAAICNGGGGASAIIIQNI